MNKELSEVDKQFVALHARKAVLDEQMMQLDAEYLQLLIDSGVGFEKHQAYCVECETDMTMDGIDVFYMGSKIQKIFKSSTDGSYKFLVSGCKHCSIESKKE